MSIQSEIERIKDARDDMKLALQEQGEDPGEGKIETYADKIRAISSGVKSFNGRSGEVIPKKGDYTPDMVLETINFGTQTSGQAFTIAAEQMTAMLSNYPPEVVVTMNGMDITLRRYDKTVNVAYYSNVMYSQGKKHFISMQAMGTSATITDAEEIQIPTPNGASDKDKILRANDGGGFDLVFPPFAPAGFGLGTTSAIVPTGTSGNPDLNLAIQNGWYRVGSTTENSPVGSPGFPEGGYHLVRVDAGRYITQTLYLGFQTWTGCIAKRYTTVADSADTWSDWEWVNPPMQVGVEYRTIERYYGKPVYVKVIDFGNLPNASNKEVAHGIENAKYIVELRGEGQYGSGFQYIPSTDGTGETTMNIGIGISTVWIYCKKDMSRYSGRVTVKYTKSTD